MSEILVAIQTKTYPGHYVRMEPGSSCSGQSGNGHVDCSATTIGASETFVLETNSDGTVSFRSTVAEDCYLSMSEDTSNNGHFECRFGKWDQEKFKIRQIGKDNSTGYQGVIGLESAQHARRWLRINNDGTVTSIHGGYPFVEVLFVGLNTC